MTLAAVIPLRYRDCFHADQSPLMELAGRPLWEITVSQALDAKGLDRLIIAHDDDRFAMHLQPWKDRIEQLQRPQELSRKGVTTLDVLAYVARTLDEFGNTPSQLMLLEVTHPLRPKGIIDQVISAGDKSGADSIITSHRIHYNFWRQDERGHMKRIVGTGDRANVFLFQELIGICSIFTPRFLDTDNPFGEQVNVVPMDRFWATIDVRNDDGLWLAERYLERTGVKL